MTLNFVSTYFWNHKYLLYENLIPSVGKEKCENGICHLHKNNNYLLTLLLWYFFYMFATNGFVEKSTLDQLILNFIERKVSEKTWNTEGSVTWWGFVCCPSWCPSWKYPIVLPYFGGITTINRNKQRRVSKQIITVLNYSLQKMLSTSDKRNPVFASIT